MLAHWLGQTGGAWLTVAATLLLGSGLAGAPNAGLQAPQPSGPTAAPDVNSLGPQVGETVPDFTLSDQHGRLRTLSSLMGPKGLVLVFNRSADW